MSVGTDDELNVLEGPLGEERQLADGADRSSEPGESSNDDDDSALRQDVDADTDDESDDEAAEFPQLGPSLAAEVASYAAELQGRRKRNSGMRSLQCKLCPYRQFCSKATLRCHQKYHHSPFYTAAASAGTSNNKNLAQFKVTRALHRMRVLETVLDTKDYPDDLLECSAKLIRAWNKDALEAEVSLLKKSNRVPLVQAWTKDGPQYILRSLTASMTRISDKLYYSVGFERLAVALSLQCRGQASQVCDALLARWAERSDAVPPLSLDGRTLRRCLHHMYTNPQGFVKNTLTALIAEATARGEWTAVSHDATYKPAFSILGQTKMSLTEGECHALHTFLGATGGCPGFSCQAKEGAPAFHSSVADLFTEDMAEQVRMLYSDSPSESLLTSFPNVLGVAEDYLHFVIRAEYCTGERRTPCTRELLQLQRKFDNPLQNAVDDLPSLIYHDEVGEVIAWDSVLPALDLSDLDRTADSEKTFLSHEEYVRRLKALTLKYESEMKNTNSKGKTLLSTIKDGSTYRHYGYLRNNSVFRSLAGGKAVKTGTTDNEALNRQLKGWGQCVYKQHVDRLESLSTLFGLYKMLANNFRDRAQSALFCTRLSERRAVMLLSGLIASNRLAPVGQGLDVEGRTAPTTRHDLWKPAIQVDEAIRASQKAQAMQRQEVIQKHVKLEMAKGRLVLKKRLRGKTSPTFKHVISKYTRRHKVSRNSRNLRDSITLALQKGADDAPVSPIHSSDID